jgi:hypothetical protein
MDQQPSPPSVEHAAATFYQNMAERAYDALVLAGRGQISGVWILDIPIPCHLPWDEFVKLNPEAGTVILNLEAELHYQFSESQLSWAVMKLRGEPYKKVFGPPIVNQ